MHRALRAAFCRRRNGGSLDERWMRPPGRPRNTGTKQFEDDVGLPAGQLWDSAVGSSTTVSWSQRIMTSNKRWSKRQCFIPFNVSLYWLLRRSERPHHYKPRQHARPIYNISQRPSALAATELVRIRRGSAHSAVPCFMHCVIPLGATNCGRKQPFAEQWHRNWWDVKGEVIYSNNLLKNAVDQASAGSGFYYIHSLYYVSKTGLGNVVIIRSSINRFAKKIFTFIKRKKLVN